MCRTNLQPHGSTKMLIYCHWRSEADQEGNNGSDVLKTLTIKETKTWRSDITDHWLQNRHLVFLIYAGICCILWLFLNRQKWLWMDMKTWLKRRSLSSWGRDWRSFFIVKLWGANAEDGPATDGSRSELLELLSWVTFTRPRWFWRDFQTRTRRFPAQLQVYDAPQKELLLSAS